MSFVFHKNNVFTPIPKKMDYDSIASTGADMFSLEMSPDVIPQVIHWCQNLALSRQLETRTKMRSNHDISDLQVGAQERYPSLTWNSESGDCSKRFFPNRSPLFPEFPVVLNALKSKFPVVLNAALTPCNLSVNTY